MPKGPINNIPALVKKVAWHQPGNKPEPMISLLMHIYITLPQWVKSEIDCLCIVKVLPIYNKGLKNKPANVFHL